MLSASTNRIIALALAVLIAGCAQMGVRPSHTPKEPTDIELRLLDIDRTLKGINLEVAELKSRIDSSPTVKCRDERVYDEVMSIEMEISRMQARLNEIESRRPSKEISIKVLSGTGDMASANELAKKLAAQGYTVTNLGYASSAEMARDTIYYSEGYLPHAQKMAAALGTNPSIRRLTWSSIFDIIAVSGFNKPNGNQSEK